MKEVFEKEATIKQWDDDYYTPISFKLYDQAISDMLQIMEIKPGETILDAGCGPGVHSIRAAKAGVKVCAIDISEAMLKHAQQRVKDVGLSDSIEFHQKDLTKLDFPDAHFDYVFSWGVIIHIPDAEKALDELARIIKPGGKLALYLTNKTALDHKLESAIRFIIRKPLEGIEQLPLGDGIWYDMNQEKLWVWRFDAKAIVKYMSKKGFRLKKQKIGELTEIQRRVKGISRNILLRINNLAYRLNFPPQIASSSLFVFEKQDS